MSSASGHPQINSGSNQLAAKSGGDMVYDPSQLNGPLVHPRGLLRRSQPPVARRVQKFEAALGSESQATSRRCEVYVTGPFDPRSLRKVHSLLELYKNQGPDLFGEGLVRVPMFCVQGPNMSKPSRSGRVQ